MQKIEDVILFQIDLTSKMSKQYSQKEFNKLNLGITVEQWIIIKLVSENIDISQKELAKKSIRDTASITRTLDILEKKGFLYRDSVPNNRRTYNICLTKKGDLFIKKHLNLIIAHRKKSIENISKEDLNILSDLLYKIRKNLK